MIAHHPLSIMNRLSNTFSVFLAFVEFFIQLCDSGILTFNFKENLILKLTYLRIKCLNLFFNKFSLLFISLAVVLLTLYKHLQHLLV